MKISSASGLVTTWFLAATSMAQPVSYTGNGEGFSVEIEVVTRLLNGTFANADIIGAHLHTGSPTTNGPVAIIFCGSAPLPGPLQANGPCNTTDQKIFSKDNMDFAAQVLAAPTSIGAWDNGVNKMTSVPDATTLDDGAPSTYQEFMQALVKCNENYCPVYFNIHTNWSFNYNAGAFGLMRAQLKPTSCPSTEGPDVLCLASRGFVTSTNTNDVHGLPHLLPDFAGQGKATEGYTLVKFHVPSSSSGCGSSGCGSRSLRGLAL